MVELCSHFTLSVNAATIKGTSFFKTKWSDSIFRICVTFNWNWKFSKVYHSIELSQSLESQLSFAAPWQRRPGLIFLFSSLSLVHDLDRHTYMCTLYLSLLDTHSIHILHNHCSSFHYIYFPKIFFRAQTYSLESCITLSLPSPAFLPVFCTGPQTPVKAHLCTLHHTHIEKWMEPAAHKLQCLAVYGQNYKANLQ